jgi:hypothetical protein
MRKRCVAHIVEQGCGARSDSIFGINLVTITQPIENPGHQMGRAQTVREARMFRALVRVQSQAQLFDSTQTLEFRRID